MTTDNSATPVTPAAADAGDHALSRSRREWEQTFDAIPDLITIIDAHHTVCRVNRAMADRVGLRPEELAGRRCHEVVHGTTSPPDSCPHARMIRHGCAQAEEVEEKRLGGIFDVTASPVWDAEGRMTACVHVMRDITARKQAEEERRMLEQRLHRSQKLESLGVLAGGIAHDFNNILTVILGHCHLGKLSADSEATCRPNFEQIEVAVNRAADICGQMLEYGGKSDLAQTQVNVWLEINEIVKMLESRIRENVTIELDSERDIPAFKADRRHVQRVVMNLIINAAEAIGDNRGTIRVALRAQEFGASHLDTDFAGTVIRPGRYACMEVSDDGCGMDEETQKRIFEPFFTTKFMGRGLGMSAMLGIITSHGGALQFSSTPGGGTVFKIYFPIAAATEVPEAASPAAPILMVRDFETATPYVRRTS